MVSRAADDLEGCLSSFGKGSIGLLWGFEGSCGLNNPNGALPEALNPEITVNPKPKALNPLNTVKPIRKLS